MIIHSHIYLVFPFTIVSFPFVDSVSIFVARSPNEASLQQNIPVEDAETVPNRCTWYHKNYAFKTHLSVFQSQKKDKGSLK